MGGFFAMRPLRRFRCIGLGVHALQKQRMAWDRYVGTKRSLAGTPGSTEKNEPVGLSTHKMVESRIVTAVGSWLQLPE